MMREFDLGIGRRCKVWIGELPPISFVAGKTVSRELDYVAKSKTASFKAATEIVIPRGARMLYGALGVEFTPSTSAPGLTIEVNVSDASRNRFVQSLIANLDEVSIGLPSEYVDAVLAGVEGGQKQEPTLSPGTLRFAYAAHGAASSNAPIFRQLALWLALTRGESSAAFNEELLRKTLLI
jgi:hypothetical protein